MFEKSHTKLERFVVKKFNNYLRKKVRPVKNRFHRFKLVSTRFNSWPTEVITANQFADFFYRVHTKMPKDLGGCQLMDTFVNKTALSEKGSIFNSKIKNG